MSICDRKLNHSADEALELRLSWGPDDENAKKSEICSMLMEFMELCLTSIESMKKKVSGLFTSSSGRSASKDLYSDVVKFLLKILPSVFETWAKVTQKAVTEMLLKVERKTRMWLEVVVENHHAAKPLCADQTDCENVVEAVKGSVALLQKSINDVILILMKNSLPNDYFSETRNSQTLHLWMYMVHKKEIEEIFSYMESYMTGALYNLLKEVPCEEWIVQQKELKTYTERWTDIFQPKITNILAVIIRKSGYKPLDTSERLHHAPLND